MQLQPTSAAPHGAAPTGSAVPVLIFTRARRGRVLLIGPNGEPVHDMLTAAGIANTGEERGAIIPATSLCAALTAARVAGWTVTPSRAARRAQTRQAARR